MPTASPPHSVLTANNTAGSFSVTAAFAASPTASFNLTILESPRSVSVNDVTFTGADSLVPPGFTVSLSATSSQTITVHYQTADGTAIAGEDYTATSGTLTFNPGETAQNVPVTILPDTVNEPAEQFFLNLDTPVNATIADNQGVGTIPNDDPEVTFSIDDITHSRAIRNDLVHFYDHKNGGNRRRRRSIGRPRTERRRWRKRLSIGRRHANIPAFRYFETGYGARQWRYICRR